MRLVPVALVALVAAACAASPRGRAITANDCPRDSDLTLESTVEGKDTWWACRDDDHVLEGPSRMTYADGHTRNVGSYRHGEADGPWTYFDRAGRVEAEGAWVKGKREGRWLWSDANSTRVEHYRDGKAEGHFTRRAPSGTLIEEGDHADGEKVGRWRTWNAQGQLEVDETFTAGVADGPRRAYHPNGRLAETSTFAKGVPVGRTVTFHDNGVKASEGEYVDGRASGLWTTWDAQGAVVAEGQMVDGEREGDWHIAGAVVHFEHGREGKLRACPEGSRERIECAARCCDRTARWCERPDGTRVGPWDVWDVGGALLDSRWTDP
jgi:antitoxin component YwqK of YwqJK toxin-antitoxin module